MFILGGICKELGTKKASGYCAKLEIIEIPDGVEWTIEDCDGMEDIVMQKQIVYLLYEESGEYSDYSIGILGVFSSVDAAKEWLEKDCVLRVEKEVEIFALAPKFKTDWTKRTSWEQGNASGLGWHSSLGPDAKKYWFVRRDWTIAPYIIDAPE